MGRYGFTTARYGPDLINSIATSGGSTGRAFGNVLTAGRCSGRSARIASVAASLVLIDSASRTTIGSTSKSGIRSFHRQDAAITAKLRTRNVPDHSRAAGDQLWFD